MSNIRKLLLTNVLTRPTAVLLVVIVPRIVPLKYVSTTLGAHKAVCYHAPDYIHHSLDFQLEQTGSTIFQTLAGLALDIKSKKSAESLSPIDGDDGDVQLLLNAFVILNVFEIIGIIGLSHLHRKQQAVAARRMSALLPTVVDGDESDEESSEEPRAGKRSGADDENWRAESPEGRRHRRSSTLNRHIPLPSSSTPEQSIPLLHGGSRSSTVRGSRYLVDAVVEEEPSGPPVHVQVMRTKAEVWRGELFSVMCGVLIAFAWVLFMVTAWLKLRSREERGGGGSGNVTALASHS